MSNIKTRDKGLSAWHQDKSPTLKNEVPALVESNPFTFLQDQNAKRREGYQSDPRLEAFNSPERIKARHAKGGEIDELIKRCDAAMAKQGFWRQSIKDERAETRAKAKAKRLAKKAKEQLK